MTPPKPDDEAIGGDAAVGGEAYDLSSEGGAEIPTWQTVAVYTLELPAKCPHCRETIRELHVLRLTRARVSFTSPLPRSGRAIVCPSCEKIISAELGGLL